MIRGPRVIPLLILSVLSPVLFGYDIVCPYKPKEFPAKIISEVLSLPLDSQSLMIVYPESAKNSASRFQKLLQEKTGQSIPLVSGQKASAAQEGRKDLIVIGSMMDNPMMLELYKKRYAFYDAEMPGKGGHAIQSVPSPWAKGKVLLLVGESRTEDVGVALDSLLALVPAKAKSLGSIRMMKTDLHFIAPPSRETVDKRFKGPLENPGGVAPPFVDIADWGLLYHLTGDTTYAGAFKYSMQLLLQRAAKAKEWVPEMWTNVYFELFRLFIDWRLIESDPYFGDGDRADVTDVLWGYGKFVRSGLPYIREDWVTDGEAMQNHPMYLALSQFFARTYFFEKYGLKDFEGLVPLYRKAFYGQSLNSIPNDNAYQYLTWGAGTASVYLMATDNDTYLKSGQEARTADMVIAVTDNLKNMVTFGDIGQFNPRDKIPYISQADRMICTAAWYTGKGDYEWVYQWLTKGFGPEIRNLTWGSYASSVAPEPPDRFCGVFMVPADINILKWSASRTRPLSDIADPAKSYVNKLSFRRAFDADAEYLLINGLSTLSHSHFDGNSINRLTWKNRIWLFDMNQFNPGIKYHNGITIVKDGLQEDIPPLTEWGGALDNGNTALTVSRVSAFNGADWTRNILWKKGAYFLVMDEVRALEEGRFRLTSRWRTRGDVRVSGNTLKTVQGDASFAIVTADNAEKTLEFEPDDVKRNWGSYPYGNGETAVWKGSREINLNRGEGYTFCNLLSAASGQNPAFPAVRKLDASAYLISQAGLPAFAGTNGSALKGYFEALECGPVYLDEREMTIHGLTAILKGGLSLRASAPVHLTVNLSTLKGLLIVPGTRAVDVEASGISIEGLSGNNTLKPGQYAVTAVAGFPDARTALTDLARKTMPYSAVRDKPRLIDFGFTDAKRMETPSRVSSAALLNGKIVLGDTSGRVFRLEDDSLELFCVLPEKNEVSFLGAADMEGKGSECLVASSMAPIGPLGELSNKGWMNGYGRFAADLFFLSSKGELLWKRKLEPNYDYTLVSDIAVVSKKGSGNRTLAVATAGWRLFGLDKNGKSKFETFIKYHRLTKIKVMPDNGKGMPLIAVGTEYITPLNVLDPSGKVLWQTWEQMGSDCKATTDYMGFHLTDLTFMDVNNDKRDEIIFGTKYNRLYAVDNADGRMIWSANAGEEVTALERLDITAKGVPLLIAGNAAGDLILLNRDGTRAGCVSFNSPVVSLSLIPYPDKHRTDIAVLFGDGSAAVVDDGLKVRAHYTGEGVAPLKLICLKQGEKDHQICIVTRERLVKINYRPYFRKECRYY